MTDYTPIDTSNLWGEQIQSPSDDPTNRGGFPGQIQPPPVPNVPSYSASADGLDPQTRAEIARQKAIADTFYTPDTTSRDRFGKMIDQAPDINKYNPGLLRTLGSIGMSMGPGGYKAAEESQFSPFMREAAMWKEKIGPAQQAATIENTSNNLERQIAGQATAGITAAERNASNEKIATERARVAQSKVDADREIGLIRARADDYMKRLGHGWQFDTTGPSVIAMNKDDPNQNFDTGIETGKLDEMTRKAMENFGKIEAAKVLGQNAAGAAAVRSTGYWKDSQGNVYQVTPGQQPVPQGDAPPQPVGQLSPVAGPGIRTGAGTGATSGVTDFKNMEARRQTILQTIYEAGGSEYQKFIVKNGDKYDLGKEPQPGWGIPGISKSDAQYQHEMQLYNEIRQALYPNAKFETTAPVKQEAPPMKPAASHEATQGLGPTKVPYVQPGTRDAPIDESLSPNYRGVTNTQDTLGEYLKREAGNIFSNKTAGEADPALYGRTPATTETGPSIGHPPRSPQEMVKPGEVLIENAATGEPKAVPAATVDAALAIRNPDGSLKYRKYTGGG